MTKKLNKFIANIKEMPENNKLVILWVSFAIIFGIIFIMWVSNLGDKLTLKTNGFNSFTAGAIKGNLNELIKDKQGQVDDFVGFPSNY